MKRKLLFLFAAVFAGSSLMAQPQITPIPADTAVRTGKFANGMTYYIRHNEKPKNQADFYITHHVGAIQENDSQQGLAHFLEHMAFNGTKNLPGKALIKYLEKIGVQFGGNLNANTSWDVTNYLIKDVPTHREGIVDTALLILHDWSHFIALEPEEIDSERGVIMEELRTRDGAGWRSTMELIKAIGKSTQYEHRNIIGYLDDLKTFQHKELEEFYNKWYRPDYQTVVVVGDIDVDAVEKKLTRLMADIPAPAADAAKKEVIVVPDNQEPIVSITTDPEMQGSSLNFIIKRPALPREINNSVEAYTIGAINNFMLIMANERLNDISMKADAPFTSAGLGSGDNLGIIPTLHTLYLTVSTKDSGLNRGFEAAYTELERIKRFGFTNSEFERAKQTLLSYCESSFNNSKDRHNHEYVDVYLNHFMKNTPMPDAATEWQLDSTLYNTIPLAAVNQYAKSLVTPHNRVITVAAPEKEGIKNPTKEELLAICQKVDAMELEPLEDNVVKEPLIDQNVKLKGSKVKSTVFDENYGTTEWTLKNGIKVVVKPTTFKNDELIMRATSFGGASILDDDEVQMANMLPYMMAQMGLGKFSATELGKQLSGKIAGVNIGTSKYVHEVKGSCTPRDLETMMQLTYLTFTQPRYNEDDYNTFIQQMKAQLENLKSNPDYLMQETFSNVCFDNNPRRKMLDLEELKKFDFAKLPVIFDKLYSSANSFLFTFVGNIDLDTLRPLVEKYLGSLPTTKKTLNYTDDKCPIAKGQIKKEFSTPMLQPKVSVRYLFSGDLKADIKNKLIMSFLSEALSSRYQISIREEKGGTYGVGVWGDMSKYPTERYEINIGFDTNDEMADELMEIIIDEIEEIAQNGPKTEDVEKHRLFLLKNWENGLEQNGTWINCINMKYFSKLDYIAGYKKAVEEITNADIQEFTRKMLNDKNMINVIMRPEKNEETK